MNYPPYPLRERRANMERWEQPEGYPGQKEKILAVLVAIDAHEAAKNRDLAAWARRGANEMIHGRSAR